NTHYSFEIQQILGNLTISTAAAANLGSHSYEEKLRIDSNGRLGIGTDNPGAQSSSADNLVIADFGGEGGMTIKTNANSAGNIFFADTAGTATGRIAYGHGTTDAGDYMRFYVRGGEKLRINALGQVGIGTNPTIAADAALHIELTDAREYLRLNADAGNNNAYIEIQADNNRR
ncbi:MAG: hypothetical protein VXY93_22010, partial [Pseudomonadota bacterium]|nr:hypothetical protein [Pseudomonadota bacterium]